MRSLIVLTLFLLLTSKACAKEVFFDFTPRKISLEGEVILDFYFDVEEKDRFRVKPISESPLYIWRDAWISSSSYWDEFPKLSEQVRIRFPAQFDEAKISFRIQDTKTAKIYESPTHKIIGRLWFLEYVHKLNAQIFEVVKYLGEDI